MFGVGVGDSYSIGDLVQAPLAEEGEHHRADYLHGGLRQQRQGLCYVV